MDLGSAHGRIQFLYDPAGVSRAVSDLNNLGSAGENISGKLTKVGGAMLAIGGIISAGVGAATGVAASFEKQMDAVNASLDLTGLTAEQVEAQMGALSETALRIGKDTQFSAGEAGMAMEELAKLGVSAEDIMGGAADATVNLAAAIGEDLSSSAQAIGAVMNVFDQDVIGVEQGLNTTADAADILTAAINSSATTLPDFMAGFRNLAPQAALIGLNFEETAAAIALFTNYGLKGADAGVSLARAVENMVNPTDEASQAMLDLGISAFDLEGKFVGFPTIMDQIAVGMKNLTKEQQLQALATIFGAEAMDVMGISAFTGGQALRDMEAAVSPSGQAAESAAIRMDNLAGAMEQLSGSVETALIAFGTPLLGGIRATTEGITGLVNAFIGLDKNTQAIIARTVALTGTLLGIGGSALIAAGYFVRLASALGLSQAAALRFLAVFGVIGALAALAAGAYAINFLGFGDAVRGAMERATKAIDVFAKHFESRFRRNQYVGMNAGAAAIEAFGRALLNATGIDITGFTEGLANGFQKIGDALQIATDVGLTPAGTALYTLAAAAGAVGLTGLQDTLVGLVAVAEKFGNTFETVFEGAKAGGLNTAAAAVDSFGEALKEIIGIDITGFTDRAASAIQAFGDVFENVIATGATPFEAVIRGIGSALDAAFGTDFAANIDRVGDSLGAFGNTVLETGRAFLEGGLISGFDRLGEALGTFRDETLTGLGDAIQDIATQITSVDLGEIAVNIAGWIQGKWEDLKTWLDQNVLQNLPSVDLGEVAANIGTWAITAVQSIADAIKAFVTGDRGDQRWAPGGGIDLGQIVVTISSWLVEQKDALATKIQETVERAKTTLGGAGATLDQVRITVQSWLVEQAIPLATELLTKVKEWAGGVIGQIPSLVADVQSWVITDGGDLAGAIGTKATELAATAISTITSVGVTIGQWIIDNAPDIGAAIQAFLGGGGVNSMGGPGERGEASTTVTIQSVTANVAEIIVGVINGISEWLESIKSDLASRGLKVEIPIQGDPTITLGPPTADFLAPVMEFLEQTNDNLNNLNLGAILEAGDLANKLGIRFSEISTEMTRAVEKGGEDIFAKVNVADFVARMGIGAGKLFAGLAVGITGALLIGAEFLVGAVLRQPLDLHSVGDAINQSITDAWNGVVEAVTGPTGQTRFPGARGEFGADPLQDIFKPLVDSMEATGQNLIEGVQNVGIGLSEKIAGLTNPFEGVSETLRGWLNEIGTSFEDIISGDEGGIFGAAGAALGGGAFANDLANSVSSMLEGIGPAVEGAIAGIPNPFDAVKAKIAEWWGQITSFDFFGLAPKDVSAEEAGAGVIDPAAFGETMGKEMAETFSSAEFVSGFELGIRDVPEQQFAGIGTALITKIQEGVTAAIQTSAAAGIAGDPSTAGVGPLVESLKSIFTGMIAPLVSAAQALDAAVFAPVGAALMTKIQEGLTSALATASVGGGGTGAVGITPAPAGLGEGIINSIITSLTAAVAGANFSTLGTSFATSIGTALNTAMTQVGATIATGAVQWVSEFTNAFHNIQTVVSNGMVAVGNAVTQQMSIVSTAFTTGGVGWFTAVSNAFTNIQTAVTNGMTAASTAVTAGTATIGTAFATGAAQWFAEVSTGMTNIQTSVTSGMQAAAAAASAGMAQFSSAIQAGMQQAVAATQIGVANIDSVLRGAADTAYASGVAVGQGFADGISSMVDAVSAAAGALAAAAVGAINAAIQPGSPSKVTTEQGVDTGQGLVVGMDSTTNAVATSADNLAQTLIDHIMAKVQEIRNSVYEMVTGAVEGGTQAATDALSEAAPVMAEEAAGAMNEVGASMGEAAGTGLESTDLCTPAQEKMTSMANCASDTIEGTAPQISNSMGTAMETAANGATPAAEDAGTTIGTAAGEAASTEVGKSGETAGAAFGDNMVQAMLGKMTGAGQAGEGIGQTAIKALMGAVDQAGGALEETGRRAGDAMSTGVNAALDEGIARGMDTAMAKATELADKIRANVEERISQMQAVQQTWLNQGQELVSDRNNDRRSERTDVRSEGQVVMNGQAMGTYVNDVSIGRLGRAARRGRKNRRR